MKITHVFKSTISFVVLALWSVSLLAAPANWPPPGLAIAEAAQAKYADELLATDGVVGHGIGVNNSGRAVLVVFTERPLLSGIPAVLDGVPVNARYTGRFYALAPPLCGGPPSGRPPECFEEPEPGIDPTARFDRPVPIGISTGHPNITAGTIGARVTDGTTLYALSNNHVFADSNYASLGDDILQPGPYDGGAQPDDVYASLSAYMPIDFSGGNNTMDAAIAETDNTQLGNATPADGYGTPGTDTVSPSVGLSVRKYGRTTGLTQGNIEALNVTVNVCYEGSPICTMLATFEGQIVIVDGSFSAGGDSGSLVVTSDVNNPVALLFAGSSSHTIATPIDMVLSEFGVTIDGQAVPSPSPTPTPTPPPEPGDFTLSSNGYKVKGLHKADLSWSGASSADVDVYRDGDLITTTPDDGFHTDNIDAKGGGSYIYQVCESGTTNCSNTSVVSF